MKPSLMIIVCMLISLTAFTQTKKECVKYHIKSVTSYSTDVEDEQAAPVRESYEEFDRQGNTILFIEFKKDGTIKRKEATAYNSMGDKSEIKEFDASGNVVRVTRFSYTPFGNKASEKEIDASGNLLKETEYTYDPRNLKVLKTTYGKNREFRSRKKWEYESF